MSFYYAKITYIMLATKYGGINRTTATPAPRTDLLNPVDYG